MTVFSHIPDCLSWEDAFHLTSEERLELVRRLAEEGPGAIDRFLEERKEQGGLGAHFEDVKRRMEAFAAERRRRLLEEFEERRKRAEAESGQKLVTVSEAKKSAEERLRELLASRDAELRGALLGGDLVRLTLSASPGEERKRGPIDVLLGFILGILAAIGRVWRSFLSFLGLRRRARRTTIAAFRGLAGTYAEIEGRVGLALRSSDDVRSLVRQRMGQLRAGDRFSLWWRKLLGLEDDESILRRFIEDEVEKGLTEKEREMMRQREELEKNLAGLDERRRAEEAETQGELDRIEREREAAIKRLRELASNAPRERLRQEVVEDLLASGLVRETEGNITITHRLIDRFADLVLAAETKSARSGKRSGFGRTAEGEGDYERSPLLSREDMSRMDIAESLVSARLNHPRVKHMFDDDVIIHREIRSAVTHAVLVMDASASMEENGRILAAKRAVLALHSAVKRSNPRNIVDVLVMRTDVRRIDLLEAWNLKPRGFTNTGRALRMASDLLEREGKDRQLLYLVTDGLPEAHTEGGEDLAGFPEKAMRSALDSSRRLRSLPGAYFVQVLLEAKDPTYVEAAESIASQGKGRVLRVDPGDLAQRSLAEFSRATRQWQEIPA
ncbi:MAG: hypothetical protein HY556_02550 [Euryarchaeota archaeon]|nr:hypothetical protein [Euryarchaeota archaeon]